MNISRKKLKDLILKELRGVGPGAVASQDDVYGVDTNAKIDKYQQHFVKMSAIFDRLRDSILSDLASGELPRHLLVHILTDQFERFEDEIAYKKQEIIAAETAGRGEIRANVED